MIGLRCTGPQTKRAAGEALRLVPVIGEIYSARQVAATYRMGGRVRGIGRSSDGRTCVITGSRREGRVYADRNLGADEWEYKGQGLRGDHSTGGANGYLIDSLHREADVDVFRFVGKNRYRYEGTARVLEVNWSVEPDLDGRERRVLVFHLLGPVGSDWSGVLLEPGGVEPIGVLERRWGVRRVSLRTGADSKRVYAAWGYACAVCGRAAVEAAHLIPWRDRPDPRVCAQIALCPNHHQLYDMDIIRFRPTFEVVVNDILAAEWPELILTDLINARENVRGAFAGQLDELPPQDLLTAALNHPQSAEWVSIDQAIERAKIRLGLETAG